MHGFIKKDTNTNPSTPKPGVEVSAESAPAINRREFIGRPIKLAVTAAMTAPFVARALVLGANNRIGVGFIGAGGCGRTHLAGVQGLIKSGENLQITCAILDRHPEQKEPPGQRGTKDASD
jgi:hypothetical protein